MTKLIGTKCACGARVVKVRTQYGKTVPLEPTRKSREPSHAAWVNRKGKQVALDISRAATANVVPDEALLASEHRCKKTKGKT